MKFESITFLLKITIDKFPKKIPQIKKPIGQLKF